MVAVRRHPVILPRPGKARQSGCLLTPALRETGLRRRLLRVATLLTVTVGAGTLGYMALEGWGLLDALYMTVITLSTVGFGEVRPLSAPARVFTIAMIMSGVGMAAYAAGSIGEYFIGGQLTGSLRRRRMQQSIDRQSGHYVICGFGRVGRQVAQDLQRRGASLVVIESGVEAFPDDGQSPLHIAGDATHDRSLRQAGIERARGLVAAAGDDGTNIVITLSARALNPDLVIVARASQPGAEDKLRRAGATHVVSPYQIGGQRIVSQLLHPRITDFLDVVMQRGNLELWLEEITIRPDAELCGKALGESGLTGPGGVNVLAVDRPGARLMTNPPSTHRLEAGEVLIALGTLDQLELLARLAGHPGPTVAPRPSPAASNG